MKRLIRRNNNNGFTLAELLIVVAIIAVLVAVSIPVFTAQLNKAKYATDEANARSIYAVLTADYLGNGKQTYVVDSAEVVQGTSKTIKVKNGETEVDSFQFNGMATITISPGSTENNKNAPYVVVGACAQNDGEIVFGTKPTSTNP